MTHVRGWEGVEMLGLGVVCRKLNLPDDPTSGWINFTCASLEQAQVYAEKLNEADARLRAQTRFSSKPWTPCGKAFGAAVCRRPEGHDGSCNPEVDDGA